MENMSFAYYTLAVVYGICSILIVSIRHNSFTLNVINVFNGNNDNNKNAAGACVWHIFIVIFFAIAQPATQANTSQYCSCIQND